jgi:hypothetical protein
MKDVRGERTIVDELERLREGGEAKRKDRSVNEFCEPKESHSRQNGQKKANGPANEGRFEPEIREKQEWEIGNQGSAVVTEKFKRKKIVKRRACRHVAEKPVRTGKEEIKSGTDWTVRSNSGSRSLPTGEEKRKEAGNGKDIEERENIPGETDDHQGCYGLFHKVTGKMAMIPLTCSPLQRDLSLT